MVLKQKIYNFLATINDYQGLHYIADAYRKGDENIIWAIIDLLFIWTFPLNVLFRFILTHRFHKPNCDCNRMKRLKKSYEKSNEE